MAGKLMRREVRVALSLRAQPAWFRIVKWLVLLGVLRRLRGRPAFWPAIGGGAAAGLLLHGFYRRKTAGWTRPWGGWDDVATAGAE